MTPEHPTSTKAWRQPKWTTVAAINGGAKIAPTEEPLLKIPEASARSGGGNHSETTFTAAGQLPASPIPSRKRHAPRLHTPPANLCNIDAADHQAMQSA